jgi:hypothetical protein
MTDRYHDAASPLRPTDPASPPRRSARTCLPRTNYDQAVNYNQQQTDVLFDLTSKLTLRGGYRYVWGDATVLAGLLSQSGPLASGQLSRNVGLAGLTFRPSQKLSVNLDYEGASSDRVYFRTSLNDYYKLRARARYQVAASLMLQANFQVLNNQNPARQHSIQLWEPRQFPGRLLDSRRRQAHHRDGRVRPLEPQFQHRLPGLFLSPAVSTTARTRTRPPRPSISRCPVTPASRPN